MKPQQIREIVLQVVSKLEAQSVQGYGNSPPLIRIEASARHVHLTAQAMQTLFGEGAVLGNTRNLSQTGEFLSDKRVKLITPKGEIANVAVLGPLRMAVQVEISRTDTKTLGIYAPVNLSGDLTNAGDVFIVGSHGVLFAPQSVIVAKTHIHMSPQDAAVYGVKNAQAVRVAVKGDRPMTFDDVVVRVNQRFVLVMHIDFDEANACCLEHDTQGRIITNQPSAKGVTG